MKTGNECFHDQTTPCSVAATCTLQEITFSSKYFPSILASSREPFHRNYRNRRSQKKNLELNLVQFLPILPHCLYATAHAVIARIGVTLGCL